MNTPAKTEVLLDGYRVLDLTEYGCLLCGKILGDLGADVIKIVPLGGVLLGVMQTTRDIAECPQLHARDFFTEVAHPELDDTIRYPGAWVKSSEAPWRIQWRAPLIGEHNEEIDDMMVDGVITTEADLP